MKYYFSIVFLLLLFSCNNKQENKQQQIITPKVVVTKGYVVPKDSMAEPKVVFVDESKLEKIPVGKPKIVPTNLNVHPVGIPKIVLAGTPRICTPGQDTFLLPKTVPAIDSPFVAGIPETVIAKDMANKDQNPQNFSTYGKQQGLKQGSIRCMLQDKNGNLWFGSFGGGVSKYDGKSFTIFSEKEGLADNAVLSILEDKSGNLWFGTFNGGVSKYDGKSFTTFSDKKGLANNRVRSILEDKSGNLWFGTDGGVSKYDGKSFTTFSQKEGLANNYIWSIVEDKSGNLWFGTDGGVSKYNGNCVDDLINRTNLYPHTQEDLKKSKKDLVKSFTTFSEKEGLANNTVRSILEDKSGNLWFGTDGGVSRYDGKSFTTFSDKEGLANNAALSILEDQSGNLWFGTDGGGVSKYDGNFFTTFSEKEGLANNIVWSILEDKSENLWFGTFGGGLSKYNGKFFTSFSEKEGLANNAVLSILEDKSGNLWFGTFGGVSKNDGKSFTTFSEKEGLANNTVRSIIEDKNGNLWFGTYGGGVSKYDGKFFTTFSEKEGLANNYIWSILEDKSGNLWFGTDGEGVSKYDGKSFTTFSEKEGLANNIVWSILEDKSGNLWFGTFGGGVSKYDGKSFTTFSEKEGLANNIVWSIIEDQSGNLWFGTDGGGVSKYDGKSLTTFSEKEGLANNTVLSMLEDKSGNLWFGTRFGISKLTPSKSIEINDKIKSNTLTKRDVFFKNYSYSDGFLGIGVYGGKTMLQAKDGTIWIGANDRLTAMHPENMLPDSIAPNIQLTTIELFNENIAWNNLENKKDSTLTLENGVSISNFNFDGLTKWYNLPEHLSLTYNNNYLTFNFIGITMNQPKNVKYQYMLEGIDENWSVITNKSFASYGNLPHGSYTFKVKAMNSEGFWSEPFEYNFTIRPPWWKTWWAYSLYTLFAISMIFLIVWWNGRRLRARAVELKVKVNEATLEIKEQKHLIEKKHKEITDSINYAERIQRALLASKKLLDENLSDYFIMFKPKDVVSGDFYWAASTGSATQSNFLLCIADSTGHGVPGAIMSILNIAYLEKSVEVEKLSLPNEILNHTRTKIIETLKKDGSAEGGKDGMDGSLLSFDLKNNNLSCSSANNPVWIIRENKLIEIKGDRFPVGKHDRDKEPFTLHTFDLQKGDVVYALTDGFADQFGGERGKKFKYNQLQELLLSIAHEPMSAQNQKLNDVFENWKGNLEQVDDVTVIGVRV